MGSGKKHHTDKKKNHWSLGERNREKTHLEEVKGESQGCAGGVGGMEREKEN